MKIFQLILPFICIVLFSCESQGQQPDNKKPMYGEVAKSEALQKIDNGFVKKCIDQFGSIDSSVKVYVDYGWRYYYNNEFETAMKRFNQAWLLDAEYPDIYFGFAALTETNGDKNEAKRLYEIASAKDKSKSRAAICFQRIADCKEQLQDQIGTIEAYEQILKIQPQNVFALKKLGYFQMQAGINDMAVKAFDKAIALDPNDAMTFNNRAYLYQTMKNYKNALSDYAQAIALDPKYIGAYVNRGILLMEEQKFDAAKRDFETAVKLDDKSAELWRFLALARISLKDKIGACEDLKKAKNLGDSQINALIEQNCK